MTIWVWGEHLSATMQRDALARYVHRFTRDHVPGWARVPRPDGTAYPVQFDSDGDWLSHTRFAVTQAGDFEDRARYCQSNPTWPDNPELRRALQ